MFLQTPKSKINKNHSYAIFPYKNNNHIFYDYSDINQILTSKDVVKINKKNFLYADILYVTLCSNQK